MCRKKPPLSNVLDLGVHEPEPHQVLVEVVRRLDVLARVGDVVQTDRCGVLGHAPKR